tara:strand:+ start:1681 stop:2814 length:1134 start_codon:yes stop_codon:yes gene_type:complete
MNKKNTKVNTIDETHQSMLMKFQEHKEETIPNLILEKKRLNAIIPTLKKDQVSEYMDISDKIKHIISQIRELKLDKRRYLLDNSKFIFDFFEQKKQISGNSVNANQNTDTLNTFFKIKANNDDSSDLNSEKYIQSKQYLQKYWRNMNIGTLQPQDYIVSADKCEYCNEGELIPQDEEGVLICNNLQCCKFVTYIIDSNKPSNKEPPNEVSYTAYIRLNHFKEILSQFQAKETTQIPPEVINNIRARIKKERITNMKEINYDKMRDILRKLNYNKYFEHIQYINSLFGVKPPIMNEELHETLCVLFIEIQKPWAVHCPPNRTNFFNYTYTLYQLCVLLDQTQYLPYIPMMKDREKQLEQDMIWKKVCEDLDWEYFPTV